MIIPPDTEKDPRLFAESRTSLATTDADLISIDEPSVPEIAYHRDFMFGSGPFADEYEAYPNEALPPYDGQRADGRRSTRVRRSARNSDLLVRIESTSTNASSSSLESSSSRVTARAGASGRGLGQPTNSQSVSSSTTAVGTQRSKAWEGTNASASTSGRRRKMSVNPEVRNFWKKHKRWLLVSLVFLAAALLIAIGLAVGLGMALKSKPNYPTQKPQKDKPWPGSPNASVQIGTLNITYVPRRDDPKPADGAPSECNNFAPLNMSSSLSQLALTSGYFDHYISTYEFPLANNSRNQSVLDNALYFITHGLAASGTLEFIGVDSPAGIKDGGKEDVVLVDVLARSPKDRPLNTLAKVCKLKRPDGSAGVGIFTPIETDQGGAGGTAPYLLDPLQTPAFHVIVRLPPSAMLGNVNNTVFLNNVTFTLSGMSVRVGQLETVARFGSLTFEADCRGGGIVVNYVVADAVTISGAEGTVQGTFNVSSALNINSTSGAIFANVILNNPSDLNDTSSTIESTIQMPKKRRWHKPPDYTQIMDENQDQGNDDHSWNADQTGHWSQTDNMPSYTGTVNTPGFTPTANTPGFTGNANTPFTDTINAPSGTDAASGAPQSTDSAGNAPGGNDTASGANDWSQFNSTGNNSTTSNSTSTNGTSIWVPKIPARNHTINTTFVTNDGFIFVAYLHHPPTVALQAFVASQSGMVDVSMHPNYVGPFALINLWGSIRMPPVQWPVSPDPAGLLRQRKVIQGTIDVSNDTFFGDVHNRYSQTAESAASSVTGAAMWTYQKPPLANPFACQKSIEGQGSALYALANLGDLQVTFDGT